MQRYFRVRCKEGSEYQKFCFGQSFTVTPVAELQSLPEYSLGFHVPGKMGDTRSYRTSQELSLQCSDQGKTLSFSVATTLKECISFLGHRLLADHVLPTLNFYASIFQNHCFSMLRLPICNYDLINSPPRL